MESETTLPVMELKLITSRPLVQEVSIYQLPRYVDIACMRLFVCNSLLSAYSPL